MCIVGIKARGRSNEWILSSTGEMNSFVSNFMELLFLTDWMIYLP